MPLDVGYALLATTPIGARRIIELKGRPKEKPLVVLATPTIFTTLTQKKDISLLRLGVPVGILTPIPSNTRMGKMIPSFMKKDGKTGVFMNQGDFGNALARYAFLKGQLLFGSSANISGSGNHYRITDVESHIQNGVNYAIDGGLTRYHTRARGKNLASTIIDINKSTVTRRGFFARTLEREVRRMRRIH